MKKLFKLSYFLFVGIVLISCQNTSKPNYEFFPNMYRSVAYETYAESESFNAENQLKDQTAQLPAEGSIKRGYVPYEIENSTAGYDYAKANLKSPLDSISEKDLAKRAVLYGTYCVVCHGEKGDGQGPLVKNEKFLGVPSYADRDITEGSTFHVITYGLNSMGSHASQITQHERWLISNYVLELKSKL